MKMTILKCVYSMKHLIKTLTKSDIVYNCIIQTVDFQMILKPI